MMTLYARSKGPVVHVRVRWITETGKNQACTCRTGYSAAIAAAVGKAARNENNEVYKIKCCFFKRLGESNRFSRAGTH